MKKVFLALSLTLFVGTVAMANYSSSDNTIKTEVGKKEKCGSGLAPRYSGLRPVLVQKGRSDST